MAAFYRNILLLALALVIVAGCFSGAKATETRVGTMGGIGLYTHDNSNIFYFPGAIYTYSGQVIGEFRLRHDKNSFTVGVNYPFGSYSVIGAYLNRPIVVGIPANVVQQVTLNQTTDLFYGVQMAKYDLGIRLSVGLDSYKNKDTLATNEEKESARYIALGVGLTNESMDLGLNFEMPHAKRELGNVSNTWSGFGVGVNARMFRGQNTKLVPLGTFFYRKTSAKFEPGAGKVDYTDMNLGLGLGLNHQINENNLLVMAAEIVGFSSSKSKIKDGLETTDSRFVLPGLFMGLESKIKTWLTGRVGVSQVWQSDTHKEKPFGGKEAKSTQISSPYDVNIGMGFNFGDFVIDTHFNDDLFFDGPNFISGGVDQMFHRISVTYKF